MDKETLSNYGWIVICVMVLAVMLALATPFGNFVAEGFKATYAGFGMVGDNALGVVIPGSETPEVLPEESIPVKDPALNPDDGTGVYDGMIYKYGNYEYCYGYAYCHEGHWGFADGCEYTCNGWAVHCINNVADPGPILETINGEPITDMCYAFNDCLSLVNAPVIPSTVTAMDEAFASCKQLTTAPTIPDGVVYMYQTFCGCTSLITAPEIPSSVISLNGTFKYCTSLTGTVSVPCHITTTSWSNCPATVVQYHYDGCGH